MLSDYLAYAWSAKLFRVFWQIYPFVRFGVEVVESHLAGNIEQFVYVRVLSL